MTSNLTPEEDAIGDPIEESDEIDDTLPADLWFRDTRLSGLSATSFGAATNAFQYFGK